MLIRRIEDKIYKINIKEDEKEFLKNNPNNGFQIVENLPFSKFEKWKIVNNEIINDEEEEQKLMIKIYENEVQNHLNNVAKNHRYDNIDTACLYASIENPFQEESKKFVAWRGNVWAYCYQMLNDIKDKRRTIPTIEEMIFELPKF